MSGHLTWGPRPRFPLSPADRLQNAATKGKWPAFLGKVEDFVMFRRVLASLGLLVLVLTACDQQVLIAGPLTESGDYEVVRLVAE